MGAEVMMAFIKARVLGQEVWAAKSRSCFLDHSPDFHQGSVVLHQRLASSSFLHESGRCAVPKISCLACEYGSRLSGCKVSRGYKKGAVFVWARRHERGVIRTAENVDEYRRALERSFVDDVRTGQKDEGVFLSSTNGDQVGHGSHSVGDRMSKDWASEQDLTKQDTGEVTDWQRSLWAKLNTWLKITPHARGIILLNLLTFLYGSNISVLKNEGALIDPTLFTLGRFAIASLAFVPFLSNAFTNKQLLRVGGELGLWASAGYLTQCMAVLTSDASRVSFISTFTVIVVPLLAGLSGAKITKITWAAALSALVGVAFLESSDSSFAIGDVWSLFSAVMFGVHMYRTEQLSPNLLSNQYLPVVAVQMVVITFCSGIWAMSGHFGELFSDSHHYSLAADWIHQVLSLPWLALLYTGLFTTVFCLWCELVALKDVKATEAAIIYTLEPLWGAAFAWMLMGERWGANGWIGAAFILSGCLTMQIFGHPKSSDSNASVVELEEQYKLESQEKSPEGKVGRRS